MIKVGVATRVHLNITSHPLHEKLLLYGHEIFLPRKFPIYKEEIHLLYFQHGPLILF